MFYFGKTRCLDLVLLFIIRLGERGWEGAREFKAKVDTKTK
jgi:hypothetical protein